MEGFPNLDFPKEQEKEEKWVHIVNSRTDVNRWDGLMKFVPPNQRILQHLLCLVYLRMCLCECALSHTYVDNAGFFLYYFILGGGIGI